MLGGVVVVRKKLLTTVVAMTTVVVMHDPAPLTHTIETNRIHPSYYIARLRLPDGVTLFAYAATAEEAEKMVRDRVISEGL